MRAGHEVLVEVDDNNAMIVVNPWGILGRQLRPRQINLLNIIIIIIIIFITIIIFIIIKIIFIKLLDIIF